MNGENTTAKRFEVPALLEGQIDELVSHYPQKKSAALMVLHTLQEHFGYISRESMEWTAEKLQVLPLHILELVTFYPMLRQSPIGRFHLKVCRTLSCALSGSYALRDYLCDKLGLDRNAHGPQTTTDGKFTVEFVECLASCGSGPVMMVNDDFYEKVTQEKAEQLMKGCQ